MSLTKKDSRSKVPSVLSISYLRGTSRVTGDIADVFYHDCSPEFIAFAETHLVPEPARPNFSKIKLSEQRFGSIPCSYICCTEDQGLSLEFQQYMIGRQPCDKVATLKASHSHFYSIPDGLVRELLEVSE